MFGNVSPLKPELKIKEYIKFRSYYCGVCKSLGKNYQQLSRFSLNFDTTFLSLILSSLSEDKEQIVHEKCIANPFKAKPVVRNNRAVDYAASINVALSYYNLIDNWKDGRNPAALGAAYLLMPSLLKGKKRYAKHYKVINNHLKMLDALEKERIKSIDRIAHPFAELISFLMQFPDFDDSTNKTLKWLGYNLGKWIYLLDAFDDIERDYRSKSYNVFVEKYGYSHDFEDIRALCMEEVEFVLSTCVTEIGRAYELLDIRKNKELLDNIIFLGLTHRTRSKLESRGESTYGSIQSVGG